MIERIFATPEDAGNAIAAAISDLLFDKPDALICLAAGHSSLPAFAALMRTDVDTSRLSFVAMDEWAGMNQDDPGSCGDFLRKNFLDPLGIGPDRRRLFDGRAPDPAAECAAVEEFIASRGGIDFMLLGMGMNGHLALNEPGCDFAAGARYTELSASTREVGLKYFPPGSAPALSGGLTLGISDIIAARDIIVCVTGAHKAEAVRRLRTTLEEDPAFPATALKAPPQARFYLDQAAAGE